MWRFRGITAGALALLCAGWAGAAGAAGAAPAPQLAIATLAELPLVNAKPYDETGDANAAVDAALARAKASHKRLLIDLGGNWCGDCIVLYNLMQLPQMQSFIGAHYEVALVDVGRFDKNLDVPARFGVKRRLQGVPSVLVIDADGRLVDQGHIAALADARSMKPQAIADWLAQWTD